MCQVGGNCSCELVGVVNIILKGLCHFGVSLAFGWVVLTLVPSSHTSWFGEKVWDGVEGPFCFMISDATARAAETSERSWLRTLSYSFTVKICKVKVTGGRNSNWKPYQISKGECPVALWDLMLWANSAKGSR